MQAEPFTTEPYSFLFNSGETRLDMMTAIREYIEERPPTTQYIRLSSVTDSPRWWHQEMAKYHGSWRYSQFRQPTSSATADLWANPNGAWANRKTDVEVKCQCGALIRTASRPAKLEWKNDDHAADCKPSWHHHSRAKLWGRREWALVEGLKYDWDTEQLRVRIGQENVQEMAHQLGLDFGRLRERSYEKRANTMLALKRRGYSPTEIGEAMGYANSTVRRSIRNYADEDVAEVVA